MPSLILKPLHPHLLCRNRKLVIVGLTSSKPAVWSKLLSQAFVWAGL